MAAAGAALPAVLAGAAAAAEDATAAAAAAAAAIAEIEEEDEDEEDEEDEEGEACDAAAADGGGGGGGGGAAAARAGGGKRRRRMTRRERFEYLVNDKFEGNPWFHTEAGARELFEREKAVTCRSGCGVIRYGSSVHTLDKHPKTSKHVNNATKKAASGRLTAMFAAASEPPSYRSAVEDMRSGVVLHALVAAPTQPAASRTPPRPRPRPAEGALIDWWSAITELGWSASRRGGGGKERSSKER